MNNNPMPLNGPRVISAVESALSGYLPPRASTTTMIRYHLGGTEEEEDTSPQFPGDSPDGTNGATKSKVPATDRSQGHGARDPRPQDPLLEAIQNLKSIGNLS